MEELKVIQGDTLECLLTIENPEQLEINRVLFNCPSLQLAVDLTPANLEDDSLWALIINSEYTVDLRVGRWGYDITAYTDDNKQYTVIHNGDFIVKHKRDRSATPTPIPPGIIGGIGYTED